MRILVFGGNGMLGHKLVQILRENFDVWATIHGNYSAVERYGIFDSDRTIGSVDVTDLGSVRKAIETARPDVVINSVGIIKQVPALQDVLQTLAVNSVFPHRIASLSDEYGFRLITISTDCVFDGKKGNYSESDIADAGDLYGISKLLGEVVGDNCLTIRTSIIGRELASSHSIVEWFLSHRGSSVKGFTKAIYTGFSTIAFGKILSAVISDHPEVKGLYHVSSEPITKFELLHLLNEHYQANVLIEPADDYVIDRSLDSSRFRLATGFEPADWNEMIKTMAADPTPYDSWRQ